MDEDVPTEIKTPTKKCCVEVYPSVPYGAFKGHQCKRWGRFELNNRVYCKQHLPRRVKAAIEKPAQHSAYAAPPAQAIEEFQKQNGGGGAGGPVHEGGGGGIGKIIEKDDFLDRVNLYLKTQAVDDEWWFEVEEDLSGDADAKQWVLTAFKNMPDGNTKGGTFRFDRDALKNLNVPWTGTLDGFIELAKENALRFIKKTPKWAEFAPQEPPPEAMEELVKAKASTAQQQVQMNKDTQMEKAFKARWPDVDYAKHLVAGTMLPGGGEKYLYNGEAFLELAPVQFTSIELSDRHQIVITQAFKYIGDGE